MSDSESDFLPLSELRNLSKKRKKHGRVCDVKKYIGNHTFETGDPCNCKRFECFDKISEASRKHLINNFNSMADRNTQNIYLCGLISIQFVVRRRPRKTEFEAKLRNYFYKFKVRILDEQVPEIEVCQKAFMSLHGITNRRLITLKKYLQNNDKCTDMRGKHKNRPHKMKICDIESVRNHIKSFKGRKAHYSLNKTQKLYLPDDLNVKKMHKMFRDKYPGAKVSYESYRKIFVNEFNISFGFPRTDTCSFSDKNLAKLQSLQSELKNKDNTEEKMISLQDQIKKIETESKLHKLKASTFYNRKREAKRKVRKNANFEAITMDYCKNLPTPNITTNDVYYKRQLTFISFNIHVLSNNDSVFYTYPQTISKKGADEVTSFLNHFCFAILPPTVRNLEIFCDSCAGQNKNHTIIRFLHYLIFEKRRFDVIKITFPIRGHSYLECDKDFGLINQKSRVEVPSQWIDIFKSSRAKPNPFKVIECTQEFFCAWTKFLKPFYRKAPPFATRPIRELILSNNHPRLVKIRESYNGAMRSFVINNPKSAFNDTTPEKLHTGLLPLPKNKYDQLQELKVFISDKFQKYYENLPFDGRKEDSDDDNQYE